MAGDWSAADLAGLLTVFAHEMATLIPPRLQRLRDVFVQHQPRLHRGTTTASQRNIAHHYDLSNELFALFLDPTLTYSSALFDETPSGEGGSGQSSSKISNAPSSARACTLSSSGGSSSGASAPVRRGTSGGSGSGGTTASGAGAADGVGFGGGAGGGAAAGPHPTNSQAPRATPTEIVSPRRERRSSMGARIPWYFFRNPRFWGEASSFFTRPCYGSAPRGFPFRAALATSPPSPLTT